MRFVVAMSGLDSPQASNSLSDILGLGCGMVAKVGFKVCAPPVGVVFPSVLLPRQNLFLAALSAIFYCYFYSTLVCLNFRLDTLSMSPAGVLQNTPASLPTVMLNLELICSSPKVVLFKKFPFPNCSGFPPVP